MSDYYCDICKGTIKMKYILKFLTTRLHRDLSTSVVKRYCVKNPTIFSNRRCIKKHFYDYNGKLGFFIIIYDWKLDFNKIIICVKSERRYNIHSFWDLRRY